MNNLSVLPKSHNWHPSYPSGELVFGEKDKQHRNYRCLDCNIEISFLYTSNRWVLGYFASTKNIDVRIPSCEEVKMDQALK